MRILVPIFDTVNVTRGNTILLYLKLVETLHSSERELVNVIHVAVDDAIGSRFNVSTGSNLG